MASPIADSDATTGSTLKPVMNLISSMAKTLVGSVIAMVSTEPTRDGIDFVIFEIYGRDAVLSGKHAGNIVVGNETQFGQAASQLATIGALKFERFGKLVLRNQALFN
jgi:hypothetical protein